LVETLPLELSFMAFFLGCGWLLRLPACFCAAIATNHGFSFSRAERVLHDVIVAMGAMPAYNNSSPP
jgi:hypothetical protein